MDEFDPARPWVKDSRGRYHNLLAILDWPEEDSDEEQPNTPLLPLPEAPESKYRGTSAFWIILACA